MEGIDINSLIADLALILVLGAVASIVFKLLKQPVVLGYIVAGFIASPHFSFFPSVLIEANIEFWAQIGIIVLLFSLGLEFSFKKLLNVGGSAVLTALIIVAGMMSLGFVVGKSLHFGTIDSIFLGGMISMSSTTIILKALTDLNMTKRRFVPMTFAVLIVEDLFAVVLMVILSSIAINNTVSGDEMLRSILKLSFFLIIWFTVGIFVLPSIFKRIKRFMSDELLLVIAMGLCFLMVIFSVSSGFSAALGAFVMGSILAGTVEAERIERIVTPVKDLFGAVFFISVGMMVDPHVITQYAGTIALLSVVVIVGMIIFGTLGMLATGQPLKLAMESGFTLTQIGEFSFIIASLGQSLNVLDDNIYPIIVAVSVITTFTTPFFIKLAVPCYNGVEKMLPASWTRLLNGYSKQAHESLVSETRQTWRNIVKRYAIRTILYSVVLTALVLLCRSYLIPFVEKAIGKDWGSLVGVIVSLMGLSPFFFAMISPSVKNSEREILVKHSGKISYVPMTVMVILSLILCAIFILAILSARYSSQAAIIVAMLVIVVAVVLLAPYQRKHMRRIEEQFISNMNVRENRRTGHGHNLVSDLHLAYMTVGQGCSFLGEKLRNANLRERYGVNLVNIQRSGVVYPVPSGDMRIFPGDVLGVIGTEEQIQALLPIVEATVESTGATSEAKLLHFAIDEKSPLVGKQLAVARLREDYEALLVAVQRTDENGDEDYISPTPDLTFAPGDILWIAGDPRKLAPLHKTQRV